MTSQVENLRQTYGRTFFVIWPQVLPHVSQQPTPEELSPSLSAVETEQIC